LLSQQWGTKMIILFEAVSRKNNILAERDPAR
jgi:hypothetical protein